MKYPSAAYRLADQLLAEQCGVQSQLEDLSAEAKEGVERLQQEYQRRLEPLKLRFKALDRSIKKLARANREHFFKDQDRVDLPSGSLLCTLQVRVKRARGVLEALEKQGAEEAIRIHKAVDWDALETWPDQKLAQVGTERIKKEIIEYAIRREISEADLERTLQGEVEGRNR